jgi:hypothetical protein
MRGGKAAAIIGRTALHRPDHHNPYAHEMAKSCRWSKKACEPGLACKISPSGLTEGTV